MPSTPVPTSVWSALAVAQAVAYGIPWIDPNSFQPNVDANNLAFIYDVAGGRTYIKHAGDFSGTDAANSGGQYDSYVPQGFAIGTPSAAPGFTASTSRGSRLVPLLSLAGDTVGLFSAFAYIKNGINAALSYYETSGIRHYLSGVDANYPGGEMRFGTKADNGAFVEHIALDNAGRFAPILPGVNSLGNADKGWKNLYMDYTISPTIGAVVINKPAGSGNIAAAAASVVVTNPLVTANSLVLAWLMQTDATLTFIKSIIPGAGSFTITGNANATANCKFGFLVINTN